MAGVTFKLETSGLDRMVAFTNPKLFERAIAAGIRQASSTAKRRHPRQSNVAGRYSGLIY